MITPPEFDTLVQDCKKLPRVEGRIKAFISVRELQYGDIGSRNPFDVLKAKKGTCSGKHALLRKVLEAMGYEVRAYFAKHDFSKFPVSPWPKELAVYQTKTLTDYHDFLKVFVDGKWLTIDAIFDKPLEQFGFPVGDWDGVTDMALPVQSQEITEAIGDPEDHKKELIGALPAEVQKDRKSFLKDLTAMLDAKRMG